MDHGKEFNIEIGEYNVALEVNVVATIPNRYLNVTCVGNAESRVSENNRTITHIDIHGSVKDSVNTTNQFGAGGDSVTDKQKQIYSDSDLGTVNCVRHGESERLINTPPGWRPRGLCCTRFGDLLLHVVMCSTGIKVMNNHKIFRYGKHKRKQEIPYDRHKKSM